MCATPLATFFLTRLLRAVALTFAIFYSPPIVYFFLLATVRRGPLRVRAFVFVLCPRTGSPFL